MRCTRAPIVVVEEEIAVTSRQRVTNDRETFAMMRGPSSYYEGRAAWADGYLSRYAGLHVGSRGAHATSRGCDDRVEGSTRHLEGRTERVGGRARHFEGCADRIEGPACRREGPTFPHEGNARPWCRAGNHVNYKGIIGLKICLPPLGEAMPDVGADSTPRGDLVRTRGNAPPARGAPPLVRVMHRPERGD
jgi:hypothetical protein